jgi:hypothetical protein
MTASFGPTQEYSKPVLRSTVRTKPAAGNFFPCKMSASKTSPVGKSDIQPMLGDVERNVLITDFGR